MVLNISAISPPSVRIDATVDLDVTVNVLDFGEIVPVACISVSVVLIFLKNLFVPYVNSYLAQGFPLPIIKGFSIRDAYILTSNSRIIVSSDVAFIEPEVIYIPCLNQ